MPAASGVLPNLINGVSEQPSPVRLSSQMKSQVNAFSTVVGGLRKRNPSILYGTLTGFPTSGAYWHTINRDAVERYKVALEADDINVATLAGVAKTVNFDTITFSSLTAVASAIDGTAKLLYIPTGQTTFDVITTGISGDTVIIEQSTTGAWAGEETTVATITTNTTTAVTMTSGYEYRAACSIYSAGTINAVFSWDDVFYLYSADAEANLEVITVADYTFIVNKTITVAATADTSPTRFPEALIHITAGNYDKTYKIYVDDVLKGHMHTPKATWASDDEASDAAAEIQTANIAEGLMAGSAGMDHYYSSARTNGISIPLNLTTDLGTTNYTFARYNNVIHVQRKDATDFTIRVEVDEANSKHLGKVHKDTEADFADLPNSGPSSFGIKIAGSDDTDWDDYYVEFEKNSNEDGNGVWREVIAQGVLTSLDAETMPHTLVREADGTFTYGQGVWPDRTVGDLTTSAWPTFVGDTITGMIFWRNRLGFYVDESIIMSQAGSFFTFFRDTVTTTLDTDPVDVAISHEDIAIINQIVVFAEQALLIAEKTIFRIDGDELFSARTVHINPLMQYETDPDVKPAVSGERVFMAVNGTQSSQVEEFIYDEDRGLSPPSTTTDHCPGFVPPNITKMVANGNRNIVAAISSDQTDRIYVYKYYWANQQKLQSAWSYWDLDGAVIEDIDFVSEDLVVTTNRSNVIANEFINCAEEWRDELPDSTIHLDRRIDETNAGVSSVYAAGPDETTFTLPYLASGVEIAERSTPMGAGLTVKSTSSFDAVVDGDQTANDYFFGFPYETRIRLSEFIPKKQGAKGEQAIPAGKLNIHHITFTVATTAYVSVEVTQLYRADYTHVYTGPALGSVENLVGVPATDWSEFRLSVMAPSKEVDIDLVSSSSLPFGILNAEWQGILYRRKSK